MFTYALRTESVSVVILRSDQHYHQYSFLTNSPVIIMKGATQGQLFAMSVFIRLGGLNKVGVTVCSS